MSMTKSAKRSVDRPFRPILFAALLWITALPLTEPGYQIATAPDGSFVAVQEDGFGFNINFYGPSGNLTAQQPVPLQGPIHISSIRYDGFRVYLSGNFWDSVTINGRPIHACCGSAAYFLVLDREGNCWAQTLESTGNVLAMELSLRADRVILVGRLEDETLFETGIGFFELVFDREEGHFENLRLFHDLHHGDFFVEDWDDQIPNFFYVNEIPESEEEPDGNQVPSENKPTDSQL